MWMNASFWEKTEDWMLICQRDRNAGCIGTVRGVEFAWGGSTFQGGY